MEPIQIVVVKDHRLAIGADLHIAFDGVVAVDGGERRAGGIPIRPAAASWRPRCAIGRAVSQSGPAKTSLRYAISNMPSTSTRGVERQNSDADGGAGMPSLVAKDFNDQIRSAVHHLWPVEKIRRRRDKPAKSHDARQRDRDRRPRP